jgi:hypothetical protein
MLQQGPTLKDIYVRDKDGKEKEPKRLLGRVPVLDSQFVIPRPVTSATITFHGMCAARSITFYGRRAENFTAARQEGYEVVGSSGLIFPHEFHRKVNETL